MPLIIRNTTTSDNYTAATTFAGADVFSGGSFTVANNPVGCRVSHGPRGQAVLSDEYYLPPGNYTLSAGDIDPISGIQFRSFIAGNPAQVFGSLYYPRESRLFGGNIFDAIISAGGAFAPNTSMRSLAFTQFSAPLAVTTASTEAAPLTVFTLPQIAVSLASQIVLVQVSAPQISYDVAGANTFGLNIWASLNSGPSVDLGRIYRHEGFGVAVQRTMGGVTATLLTTLTTGTWDLRIRGYAITNNVTIAAGPAGVGAYLPAQCTVYSVPT